MRIGLGYDSHRFEEKLGKPLVLAGVGFSDLPGLKAHSDGDVVIHAVIDALLGAAAQGDIGSHFPDTDEQWKGADSALLLASVAKELAEAGYRLGNLDVTIICERPRIRPQVEAMRASLASLLAGLLATVDRISVKGKTNEKMDDVGAGIGIEVKAVCLLEESRS